MAWRRPGGKPLSEAMLVSSPTHICLTWPQWVNLSDWWLKYILQNSSQINVTGPDCWAVNIGSGNDLMPSGNKPLPEPMLTQFYVALYMASIGHNGEGITPPFIFFLLFAPHGGKPSVTGDLPAQRANNAESVPMSRPPHATIPISCKTSCIKSGLFQ